MGHHEERKCENIQKGLVGMNCVPGNIFMNAHGSKCNVFDEVWKLLQTLINVTNKERRRFLGNVFGVIFFHSM